MLFTERNTGTDNLKNNIKIKNTQNILIYGHSTLCKDLKQTKQNKKNGLISEMDASVLVLQHEYWSESRNPNKSITQRQGIISQISD